jgi:hypothetical protein
MTWSILEPQPATASSPATVHWWARSPNYEGGQLRAASLDQLVESIDAFGAAHPMRLTRVDGEGIALAGLLGALGGGAVAVGASLLGFPRIAKLGGVKALFGVGLAGVGYVIAAR